MGRRRHLPGSTALFRAAEAGHEELVQLLVQAGELGNWALNDFLWYFTNGIVYTLW